MEGIIYKSNGEKIEVSKPDPDVTLKYLQDIVEGYIEMIHLGDGDVMVINEEGKLDGLPYNESATKIFQERLKTTSDFIVGNVLVTKSKYIS